MTEGQAQSIVNSAALVVAAIYFYRRLIEPAAGASPAPKAAGSSNQIESPEGPETSRAVFDKYRGPAGSFDSFESFTANGEPATVSGAAAQLLGEGKPPSTERFVVGWGFTFLTLSLMTQASPQLGGSFAALVALGSVLTNGSQVSKDVNTQLRSKTSTLAATDTATATPTTLVDFAGAAGNAPAVITPEGQGKKKKSAKPKFRVQSA